MTLTPEPAVAAATLARADKQLAKIIRAVGPPKFTSQGIQNPFQTLAEAIVYQQLSGKAAATIHGRLVKALGGGRKFRPQAVLDAPDETLRGAGLSRAKTAALRDLAAKTLDGTVPTLARLRRMEDDEIIERLVSVRGVGVWTVEMLLLFRLGRPDVLPVSDLGVRKGFMLTYGLDGLPTPTELRTAGERWRPYRSTASWYFWRAVELLGR